MDGLNWFMHLLLLGQRSLSVVVPDLLLGQKVWGGDKKQWPSNWRGFLGRHLVPGARLKTHNDCSPACPMHTSGIGHGHFRCTIDRSQLGVLDDCGYDKENGERCYDWTKAIDPFARSNEPTEEAIREYRNQGRLAAAYLPVLVFGSSKRVKLSREQQQVLFGITHELTRTSRGTRPDKAMIIMGGVKSIGPKGARVAIYPQLKAGEQYVAFNGNGRQHLRGRGYRLIGRTGKGWLARAGYDLPSDARGRWRTVPRFLRDLDALAGPFDLVVAGWHDEKNEWKSLAEMQGMVRNREGRRWLRSCLLRIYAPADYLARWRQYFAAQMGLPRFPAVRMKNRQARLRNMLRRLRVPQT
ncbi:hypothetical protein AYO40_00780 [Planctomycetaceae bacterium SCGC AG-212-D15]|nr:hypothetical protein AYO40_00780 [Planctomycetaceae bacterium SCGC AG-212-D15]